MGFYYFSLLGTALALLLGFCAAGAFWLLWRGVLNRNISGKVFAISLPLFLLLPWSEELWIAYNFDRHCRQDAGIFVYKTVEVEGFYDAARETHAGPRSEEGARDLDRDGYRFYEMVFSNYRGGPNQIVHFEKISGVWKASVLDHPTARYHYRWPHVDTPIGHKVDKIERVVVDSQTGELLARETKYRREAPWFYIGLDRPVILCPAPGKHPLEKHGAVFNLALKPKLAR
jgi:hypothetical protein